MQMQRQLLTIATVVECLAGLAFLLAPGATVALLLGVQPDRVGLMVARVAAVALVALGIACWGARMDPGGEARTGTLRAITFYNAGAGLLLVVFGATGMASGSLVWGAALLHLGLAAGFAASLRRSGDATSTSSGLS
jgi:hypothetical protein